MGLLHTSGGWSRLPSSFCGKLKVMKKEAKLDLKMRIPVSWELCLQLTCEQFAWFSPFQDLVDVEQVNVGAADGKER